MGVEVNKESGRLPFRRMADLAVRADAVITALEEQIQGNQPYHNRARGIGAVMTSHPGGLSIEDLSREMGLRPSQLRRPIALLKKRGLLMTTGGGRHPAVYRFPSEFVHDKGR